jgi:hypothetical protein
MNIFKISTILMKKIDFGEVERQGKNELLGKKMQRECKIF